MTDATVLNNSPLTDADAAASAADASVSQLARAISKEERASFLASMPEVEFHRPLRELLSRLYPNSLVEITHGTREFGKDLVMVLEEPLGVSVTAFVVKSGDIAGKTAGEVDGLLERAESTPTPRALREVLSQISQARSHSAKLKSDLRELTITRVVVVIAGQVSSNARDRITRELALAGDVKDLNWLVDRFTDTYPEVFFDGLPLTFLQERIAELEKDALLAKAGKLLSDCFVEPLIARIDGGAVIDDAQLALSIRDRRVRLADLAASSGAAPRRILLLGEAGSGKSRALAKYCIDKYKLAAARLTARQSKRALAIPVLVSARELVDTNGLHRELTLIPSELQGRLHVDALLVDGLDEVAAVHRDAVLARAKTIAKEHHASLIVSSRNVASLRAAPEGFIRHELLPFQISQAAKLFEKLLAGASQLPELKAGLEKIRGQIPFNPLALLLLAEVVVERKEVPASITELYDRYFDQVLGRWDTERGITVLFDYLVKRRFLAALARFEFYDRDRLSISRADFQRFASDYAERFGWTSEQFAQFVPELERTGVLVGDEEVQFRHRSFLEYFVAYHVSDNPFSYGDRVGFVGNAYFDEIWSEIAFYFTGLARTLYPELLNHIIGFRLGEAEYPLEKMMIGRLLQAGWHSETEVKARGIEAALERVPAGIREIAQLATSLAPEGKAPVVITDLAVLVTVETSLSSTFLEPQLRAALAKEELNIPSLDGLYRRLTLVRGLARFSAESELESWLGQIQADIRKLGLDSLDEARLLVQIALAEPANAELVKRVNRRLGRILKANKGLNDKLLPKLRPGYRKPSRRPK
jgi:hypothetical protein